MVILKGSFIPLKPGLTADAEDAEVTFLLFSFDSAIARQGLVLS